LKLVTNNFKELNEGSNVNRLEDENVRLTVTQKVNRRVDAEKLKVAYQNTVTAFGEEVAKNWFAGLFEYKPTLNLKNYRMLETSEDEQTKKIYQFVSQCITSSDGKPSLSVMKIHND